ncbi:uncharacterized protein LOC117282788 [Cryptotermes secundus]|uniref:uncharacterized protein LOC117282788 n=1 Tax=Cryptotermes secundus TaxID=105785 RepID=UPI001454CE19|nr:uncharacterized protein LOC117282788 [Cryptotermes secundus]
MNVKAEAFSDAEEENDPLQITVQEVKAEPENGPFARCRPCRTHMEFTEHQRHIRLEHLDKSAVAEHSIDLDHRIEFHKTAIITSKSRYLDRIILEAVEIKLHPNNMKKETVQSQQVMEATHLLPQEKYNKPLQFFAMSLTSVACPLYHVIDVSSLSPTN